MSGKINKKKRFMYTKEALDEALRAISTGMPINTASSTFNIPRTSLYNRSKGKYANKKPGPQSILSPDEEKILVEWILRLSERGFPVTKEQLFNSVEILMKKLNKENPFTNGRPGRHWYNGFLGRHPQLCSRITENVSLSRALVTENALRKWFGEVQSYLEEKNLLGVHASRVFNADETALLLNPKGNSVLAAKGNKNVYNVVGNNEKESLTALITANAAGQIAPPLILFSYQRIPSQIFAKMPSGWSYGRSDNGWMTAENFFEYVANVFFPWVVSQNIELPVILFVDGHASHLTQPLSDFCVKNKIELVALYPNSTHIIQPMDVALFYPLKCCWRKAVNTYRLEHDVLSVQKEDVGVLLKKVLESINAVEILRKGFIACGLCPLSADAVDYSKVLNKKSIITQPSTADDTNTAKYQVALEAMQEVINPDTLEKFKKRSGTGVWTGSNDDKNLFYVWKQIVHLSGTKNPTSSNDDIANTQAATTVINTAEMDSAIDSEQRDTTVDQTVEQAQAILNEAEAVPQIIVIDQLSSVPSSTQPETSFDQVHNVNIGEDGVLIFPYDVPDMIEHQVNEPASIDEIEKTYEIGINSGETEMITVRELTPLRNVANSMTGCSPKDPISVFQNEVPSPFKKALFWPKMELKKNKRPPKEKVPTVITSVQWQKFTLDKEEKKRLKEEQQETKKKIRLENMRIKKEADEIKKQNKRKKEQETELKKKNENEKGDIKKRKPNGAKTKMCNKKLVTVKE